MLLILDIQKKGIYDVCTVRLILLLPLMSAMPSFYSMQYVYEVRNVYFVQSDMLAIPQCMYAVVILSTMSQIVCDVCNIHFSKVNGLQTSSANPQNFGDLQSLLDFANVAI